MAEREIGTIKWYNTARGYGFVTRPDGEDLFIHFSALGGLATDLKQGQRIEYDIDDSGPGPMARDVQPA